jgi:predicted negative regulator of RcsB-dependent stress response
VASADPAQEAAFRDLFDRTAEYRSLTEAIRAAAGDPAQSEIHEHLGDALYKSGRRIEARFSWQAALINAQDKAKSRIERKLEAGLTPANAAP